MYNYITCVKHEYYRCSIHVLQVYELHMYNTPKTPNNVLHVFHTCNTRPKKLGNVFKTKQRKITFWFLQKRWDIQATFLK